MKRLHLILSLFLILISTVATAQVTTSSISGKVTDEKKESLIGASVLAVHEPSGTQYGTITNAQGRFNIQGMRSGGPYRIEIQYIGYQPVKYKDVTLRLGESESFTVTLKEGSVSLQEAVVIARRNLEKAGTSTNVSTRQIATLPTISRSLSDFTKLSPYAGGGNSFAGRDGRYNNITIDGAAFNNAFGLSSKNLPGGDAQPISLDAIEEISVNVAPYDVKISNFTGGSVNAITKSGDNSFKGSVYSYFRPKSFTGNLVNDVVVPNANDRFSETYGARLGGAIIKNKLFYFVNGEIENQTFPGITWSPSTNGVGDAAKNISRTSVADLKTMSDFLNKTYNYDPGKYQDFGKFGSNNWKLLGRMDWNINKANKLTVRFNTVTSRNDQQVNANSAPGTRGDSRIGINSMAFGNSNYKFKNVVTSFTGELNTTFSSKLSSKLLGTYSHIRDTRESLGEAFPFVDIYKDGQQYMSFGTELFTPGNDVINNVFSIVHNVTYTLDNHLITGGISFERQYFMNSYLRYPLGYYRYASMADFMANKRPTTVGLTYGYNGQDAPGAELTFGMGGLYAQDEWSVTNNLKLTGGLRLDRPFYFNDLPSNKAISDLTFIDGYKMDVSKWPKNKMLLSPRLGFNWDIKGDRSITLSGGTGIFTGLLPFVWFTNQPTNSGMIQNTLDPIPDKELPADMSFYPNYKDMIAKYPNLFPSQPAVKAPGSICMVDRNFKMPQVWRSSATVEFQLPYRFALSLGGMYTRDIYNVVQLNVNESKAQAKFAGPDQRDRYTQIPDPNDKTKLIFDNRVNGSVSNAMILDNGKDKGYQMSLTAVLTKKIDFGLSGSVAYTYNVAKDQTSNPGSTASSAWSSNTAINSLNDPGMSYSSFSTPHRVVANVSYEIGCDEKYKTTFSLFYNAYNTGRTSFTYSNDMNGDGNVSDLMYIPKTKDELIFKDNGTFKADEQREAFWNYVNSDKYLREHKGEYAQRFGNLRPWINRFDLKILHDFKANIGNRKYGMQLSLDVLNVGNMLNSKWGTYKKVGLASYDNIRPLKYAGLVTAEGLTKNYPTYQLNAKTKQEFEDNSKWIYDASTGSTWGMQLGLRVNF